MKQFHCTLILLIFLFFQVLPLAAQETLIVAPVEPTDPGFCPGIIISAAGPTSFTAGGNVKLNAFPDGSGTVRWYRGTTLLGSGLSYTATQAGTYQAKLISSSCTSVSNSITVSIVSGPPTITLDVSPGTSVCIGTTVYFTARYSYQPASPSYQWYVNGVNINRTSSTYSTSSLTNGSTVEVRLLSSGTVVATARKTISVFTPPNITAYATEPSIPKGSTTTLVASGGASYTYTAGSSTSVYLMDDTGRATVKPSQTTEYIIKGMNAGGCSSITRVTVVVEPYERSNRNYVLENTVQVKNIKTTTGVDELTANQRQQKINYYDGLGRSLQTILTQASPAKKDIVTAVQYDAAGREARTYLPYTAEGVSGTFRDNAVKNLADYRTSEQFLFYQQAGNKIAISQYPFAETKFERNPLNRVIEQGSPGESWQPLQSSVSGSGHTSRYIHRANSDMELRLFKYDQTKKCFYTISYYEAGTLAVTETIGEQGALVLEFKDKAGRVVAKKVQESNQAPVSDNDFLITHYVYDTYGNLRLVIQPEGYRRLPSVGKLQLERWDNVTGTSVGAIPVNTPATSISELSSFQVSSNAGDNYGQRISGNVMAPVSGNYTFWLASDNNAELWLDEIYDYQNGTDSDRVFLKIAATTAGSVTQRSHTTWLNAGKSYYIEALHKAGVGNDNLKVWWELPNGTTENPISGNNLSSPLGAILDSEFLQRWCFSYAYDGRDRITEKQVPGAGLVYIVYNSRDLPVLIQDAKQREVDEWSYTKYDGFDRVVETGLYTPGAKLDQAQMQAYIDGGSLLDPTKCQAYTQIFYDNYNESVLTSHNFEPQAALGQNSGTRSNRTDSQVTGTRTRILGSNNWLTSVNYYDDYGKVIQTILENHLGGVDRTSYRYDFTGRVLEEMASHKKGSIAYHTRKVYDYDHMGRLLEEKQKTWTIASATDAEPAAWVTLARQEYNELGQLVDKKLHNANGAEYIQSVDFRHNIRGWLTSINSSSLKLDELNDDDDDVFGQELKYNSGLELGTEAQFNGNIAEALWRSGTSYGQLHGYSYSYDKANRLIKGAYRAHSGSAWTLYTDRYSMEVPDGVDAFGNTIRGYDANGNIRFMNRRGMVSGDPYIKNTQQFGETDRLAYRYEGNRLATVNDGITTSGTGGDFQETTEKVYAQGVAESWEYTYDKNGNMTRDENKGITNVVYNHLNLPVKVEIAGKGTIEYTYNANGQKLRKMVTALSGVTTVTDYAATYVHSPEATFAHTSVGRVLQDATDQKKWRYEYHLKDHLGNLRVAVAPQEELLLTMESERSGQEDVHMESTMLSSRVPAPSYDHTHKTTALPDGTVGNEVIRLNLSRNGGIAKLKPIIVKPGSQVKVKVYAKYLDLRQSPSLDANTILGILAGTVSGYTVITDAGGTTQIFNSDGTTLLATLVANATNENNWPQAWLKCVFDNGTVATPYSAQVTNSAAVTDAYSLKGPHQELTITIPAELAANGGKLEVTLSHELAANIDVYFDDLTVTQYTVQENHYDPWGLNLAGLEKQGNPNHMFQYNGIEKEVDFRSNVLMAKYRVLDPQLGRWWQIDPMADKLHSFTPYNSSVNNPIRYDDPDGDYPNGYPGDPRYYMLEGFRQYFQAGLSGLDMAYTSMTTTTSTIINEAKVSLGIGEAKVTTSIESSTTTTLRTNFGDYLSNVGGTNAPTAPIIKIETTKSAPAVVTKVEAKGNLRNVEVKASASNKIGADGKVTRSTETVVGKGGSGAFISSNASSSGTRVDIGLKVAFNNSLENGKGMPKTTVTTTFRIGMIIKNERDRL